MMKVAISPCPNDTYIFHAWIAGLVGTPPEVTFADIQELNKLSTTGLYPLIKMSYACLDSVSDTYQLLPVGSALGYHCGPKIISKKPFSIEALSEMRIAIPGERTTAHLLLNKLLPTPKEKVFCLYHEVADLINKGRVDCGLIIHESRFTFVTQGFCEIVDLGEVWHAQHGLPLPLGCLVIRRDFAEKDLVIETLQRSLAYARAHPEASTAFILEHAQEKESSIVQAHIKTYVNEESEYLSEKGIQAIEKLTGLCLKNLLYLPKKQRQKPLCVN